MDYYVDDSEPTRCELYCIPRAGGVFQRNGLGRPMRICTRCYGELFMRGNLTLYLESRTNRGLAEKIKAIQEAAHIGLDWLKT